ncbi:hypothetical protein CR513_56911, partial [Mucuna pruriens]
MIGWSIELLQFDISYERRGHMKAQVLADFINELSPNSHEEETAGANKEWTLFAYLSSNNRGSEVGVILEGPREILIKQSLRFGRNTVGKGVGGEDVDHQKHRLRPWRDSLYFMSLENKMKRANLLAKFTVGQVKLLLVAVDYFTKWIEMESVATITVKRARWFYWKRNICHFGFLTVIVSDNDTQFASRVAMEFYAQYGIKQSFTSTEHPQSNWQVETANRVEELPQVLLSYHTTPHSVTHKTLFHLTFGINAMILLEMEESSPRAKFVQCDSNEEELRENLDLLGGKRNGAHLRVCSEGQSSQNV